MFGSGENRGQNEDLFIRKKAFKQKHLGKNKKKCETPRIFAKTENYKKKTRLHSPLLRDMRVGKKYYLTKPKRGPAVLLMDSSRYVLLRPNGRVMNTPDVAPRIRAAQ